jgi:hypothetical protein
MKNIFNQLNRIFILVLLILGISTPIFTQNNNVGIGTTSPHQSAVLELQSNTQGLLVPRREVGGADWTPAVNGEGMLRYDKNSNKLQFWNGSWKGVGLWSLSGVNAYHTGGAILNNYEPTIYLQDLDNRSGMIHQNAGLMYFLSGSGVNSTTWTTNGTQWPLILNMNNDVATFGGEAHFMEGNVGIGTNAPGEKLHVMGHTRLTDTDPTIALQDTDGRSGFIHMNSNLLHFLSGGINASTWAINGNKWPLTINMGNDAATFGGPAYFMEGNVGIGTTTPTFRLTIAGFEAIGLDNGGTLEAKNSAGNYEMFLHPRWTNDQTYLNYGSGGFNIRNNSSTVTMFMHNNGNVGIGNTNPGVKLEVSGGLASIGTHCRAGINGGYSGNRYNFWWDGTNVQTYIDGIFVGYVSDRRLKSDIKPMENTALGRLMSLKPTSFLFKRVEGTIFTGSPIVQEGFIADELQAVIPSAVTGDRDGLTSEGTIQPQTLNIIPIISVLTKAMQEQQAIIEALKMEMKAMKKALAKAGIELD